MIVPQRGSSRSWTFLTIFFLIVNFCIASLFLHRYKGAEATLKSYWPATRPAGTVRPAPVATHATDLGLVHDGNSVHSDDVTHHASPASYSENAKSASSASGAWSSIQSSASTTTPDDDFTLKPLAYVFPQFHPIPENDKFWGKDFTEWTNVNRTDYNKLGQEILKPAASIGYYNLLDYEPRKRYADLIRHMGFHGIIYHHYWFGRQPVMARVLEEMVKDGQPNVPFMLSWANEPWTRRWDGIDGNDNLLSQDYGGLEDWRTHFDWLLPYFKHPQYISVNGRLQFGVYAPAHIAHKGKQMYEAWKVWAVEEGFVGLDVIETFWGGKNPNNWGASDAIAEFQPHSSGGDPTGFVTTDRLSKTYHRSVKVAFDNSPRHAANLGQGGTEPFAHPKLWKQTLIEVMQRMKLEPNPRGQENFLFVNALNEWGEGNVLEPTKQFGSGYADAFKEAKEIADVMPWREDMIKAGLKMAPEVKSPTSKVDVCVLLRTGQTAGPFQSPFDVPQSLRSFQAQNNIRWRAIVYPSLDKSDVGTIERHVLSSFDPRIIRAEIPAAHLGESKNGTGAWKATDYIITNLESISTSCASASYLLLAESGHTYDPTAFDLVSTTTEASATKPDIVTMRFSSADTLTPPVMTKYSQHCSWLSAPDANICPAMQSSGPADTSAMFINLARWRSEKHSLAAHESNTGESNGTGGYIQSMAYSHQWSWKTPDTSGAAASGACHLVHGATYLSCGRSGRIWVDLPHVDDHLKSGCHSSSSLMATFGGTLNIWDMVAWKKDPFCLRLSEESFNDHVH